MNTEITTAGYLVDVRFWEQPDQNHTKLFVDADLLTARQAAFWYAQIISAQKPKTEVLDIVIFLTEVKNGEPYPPYIAEVFNRRFHRKEIKPDPDAVKTAIVVNADSDNEADSPIDITLDLTRVNESFESAPAVKKCLSELTCEYEYYRSYGHPPGFGFLMMTMAGPGEKEIVKEAIAIDTDEDIFRIQEKLTKPFYMKAYWLLYDALSYATSLIGNYNHVYAEPDQYLASSVQPID